MISKSNLKFLTLFFVFSYHTTVTALPEQNLVPGGIALLTLDNYTPDTTVRFNRKRVAIYKQDGKWTAIAGISLSIRPGIHAFTIEKNGEKETESTIIVTKKKYKTQRLTIKDKRKVNPYKDDMDRIIKERKKKNKAKKTFSNYYPDIDFIWPTIGRISSIFGLRRFFNDQERRPHSGLDIAAPEGTDVLACADGVIIEAGNFFFSGNLIYLDHGQGIISLYAHLSRIDVKPGDKIRKGALIGAVGQTGRVTGAHLHFAVLANQTLVDPLYLLPKR